MAGEDVSELPCMGHFAPAPVAAHHPLPASPIPLFCRWRHSHLFSAQCLDLKGRIGSQVSHSPEQRSSSLGAPPTLAVPSSRRTQVPVAGVAMPPTVWTQVAPPTCPHLHVPKCSPNVAPPLSPSEGQVFLLAASTCTVTPESCRSSYKNGGKMFPQNKVMLQPWLVWLSGLRAGLRTKGSLCSIPSQGMCLGCGPGPLQRVHERQPHIEASLLFFVPPFPSL